MTLRPTLLTALAATLVACEFRPLELPTDPALASSPALTEVFPTSGYVGQRVRIRGRNLGGRAARVFLGAAGPFTPQAGASETELVVTISPNVTTGPVAVETDIGRGAGPDFTFLGTGQPQTGRIAAALNLRPVLTVLRDLPPGDVIARLLFGSGGRTAAKWAVLDSAGKPTVLPWAVDAGAAVSADRTTAVTAVPEGQGWKVTRWSLPAFTVAYSSTVRTPGLSVADYDTAAVSLDPSGRWVMVAGALSNYLLEDTGSAFRVVQSASTAGEPAVPTDVVALGEGRFAIEQRLGIHLYDAATPSSAPRLWKPFAAPFFATLPVTAGAPGEVVVGSAEAGKVQAFRIPAATEPLVPEGFVPVGEPLDVSTETSISHLAATRTGDRIAVAGRNRVTVWDRDPAVGALASLTSTEFQTITVRGNVFLVSDEDSIVTLSAHTGAELSRLQAVGDWTAPIVGPRKCPGDLTEKAYVEVVSRHLGLARTFDASTLAPVDCGALDVPVTDRVIEAVRVPNADIRITLAGPRTGGAVLVRQGAGGVVTGTVSLPGFKPTCPEGIESLTCPTLKQLHLSSDGSRVGVAWDATTAGGDDVSKAIALDVNGAWDVAPTPFVFDAVPSGFVVSPARTVFNVGEISAVDTSRLLEGIVTNAWTAPEEVMATSDGMVIVGDALTGDRLFAYRGSDQRLGFLVDMADGALLERYEGVISGAYLFVAPSRQRAFWWRVRIGFESEYGRLDFGPDGALLGSTIIDALPVTRAAVYRSPVAGGLQMGFTPDGARGFIGGGMLEQLLVIE